MARRRSLASLAVATLLALLWTTIAQAGPPRPGTDPGDGDVGPAAVLGLSFGEVEVGTTAAPEDYIYENLTAEPMTLTVAIGGPNASDFAIAADGCSGVLAATSSCTVSVTFTPSAEYERTATLDISNGTPSTPPGLVGIGVLPNPPVSWGTPKVIGGAYTWSEGAGLARTVSSTSAYLHALVQRYDVAKAGVYYRRRTETGSSWVSGVRLNPTSQIARHGTLAAAGSRVYAAWVSYAQASPTSTQPRVLYVRVNTSHGGGTHWLATRRLTSLTGRVDMPRIAAAGSAVYIAYTNAASGTVSVRTSLDRGITWTRTELGSTTRTDSLGRSGAASVAASGTNVVVAWIANDQGTVKVRRSTNSGRTWTTAYVLGDGAYPGSLLSTAARGDRLAVAWIRDLDAVVRVRTTSWQPARTVLPSAGGTKVYAWPWNGQVALAGTSRVGFAFEACWNGCVSGDPAGDYRSDVVWRESGDNGVTWLRSQVAIQTGPEVSGEYEVAYLPSAIWPAAGTRYVMASRWYGPNELDNVVITKGATVP